MLERSMWLRRKEPWIFIVIKTFTFYCSCISTRIIAIALVPMRIASWRYVSKDIHQTLVVIGLELIWHRCSHYVFICLLSVATLITVLVIFHLYISQKSASVLFNSAFGCFASSIVVWWIKSLDLTLICTYDFWFISRSWVRRLINRWNTCLKLKNSWIRL